MTQFDPGAVPPADDPMADPGEAELKQRLDAARALLDGMRPVTAAGRFLEPDAVEAAALLREHDVAYFFHLHEELRPHRVLRIWLRAVTAAGQTLADAEQEVAEKVRLVALGNELLETWNDGTDAWCFATDRGPGCTWRLPSAEVKRYLLAVYGERHQMSLADGCKVPTTPRRQALAEAFDQIEAAAHNKPRAPKPALRVGGDGSRLVLDLCRDDFAVVEVTPAGWQVVTPSPLPMRRGEGMQPLPLPVRDGGDALGELRELLRFGGTEHASFWALFVGFMFSCLRPVKPYFMLTIGGEQGAGKTTTATILRLPIDPHETSIQSKPKSEDDLFVNADTQWLTIYDNLSALDQHWSDAFCRLSTGVAYSKRKLYSDRETSRFQLARPQVITAIVDVVAAPDLLDRSLLMQQPELDAGPAEEELLLAAVEALMPRVLGQLLDAAVVALRDQRGVKLHTVPRMVGPTKWVEAAAVQLGLEPGAFLAAYLDSQARAGEMALEASLIGGPLVDMLTHLDQRAKIAAFEEQDYDGPLGFKGTAKDLLDQLNAFTDSKRHLHGLGWPKTPRAMSGQLRRIAPALRKLGYVVEFAKAGHEHVRVIAIDTPFSKRWDYYTENNRPHRPHRPQTADVDGAEGADGQKHTPCSTLKRMRCTHCRKPIAPGHGSTPTANGGYLHTTCFDDWLKAQL